MSGWTHKIEEMWHGGYPSTLEDITVDKYIVVKFVKALMGHRMHVSIGLQRFVIANILRCWQQLISVIKSEP